MVTEPFSIASTLPFLILLIFNSKRTSKGLSYLKSLVAFDLSVSSSCSFKSSSSAYWSSPSSSSIKNKMLK
jgi:hypothetical protein